MNYRKIMGYSKIKNSENTFTNRDKFKHNLIINQSKLVQMLIKNFTLTLPKCYQKIKILQKSTFSKK